MAEPRRVNPGDARLALTSGASLLGMVSARVQGDLQRFKEFIERRGTETGPWRGEIRAGQLTRPGGGGGRWQESA